VLVKQTVSCVVCCFVNWLYFPFPFARGVGLSLFSCRYICTAPVRGGTYFLCGRKESRQRKRLKPPAFRCPPPAHLRSGPRTIRSLALPTSVTQQSSTPLRTPCVAGWAHQRPTRSARGQVVGRICAFASFAVWPVCRQWFCRGELCLTVERVARSG
jgi:hypothetical protein